jgi:hypothetical protein
LAGGEAGGEQFEAGAVGTCGGNGGEQRRFLGLRLDYGCGEEKEGEAVLLGWLGKQGEAQSGEARRRPSSGLQAAREREGKAARGRKEGGGSCVASRGVSRGHLIARKQEVASRRWPAMVLRRARRCLLSQ